MVKIQFSNIITLTSVTVVVTALDLIITTLIKDFALLQSLSGPILVVLLFLSLLMVSIAFMIWRIILREESKVETRHKTVLYIAAALTLASGVLGIVAYITEIILISGYLGAVYTQLDLAATQYSLLMNLTLFTKMGYNISALTGCLLTGFVWTRQFRIWARYSNAPIVNSFFYVGLSMIILFVIQIATITLQYFLFWLDLGVSFGDFSPEYQLIFFILLVIATLVLPVYLYFLAVAGQNLRIPYEQGLPKSRTLIILPFGFFLLWFVTNLMNVGGDGSDSGSIIAILGVCFLVAAFLPISIGFIRHARRVGSAYLRKNLYLASLGSVALSTISVVGPSRWTGITVLTGYVLAFSVFTWSLANISQFLGSREALSQRLGETGAQFLADLGHAELKGQSIQKFTRVLAEVSQNVMQEVSQIEVRTPPTDEEIRRYILSTMGAETTPTETEVRTYLEEALKILRTT
ncbi:MAG: hypothetical protein ACFFFG_04235 [Candidatus Thorarchaeota archaeon]